MSRWKSLPESLDERLRRLVVEMRQQKDHSGLSLSSLGTRTAYSRSSWERYLNGKAVPPRGAVEALARATGAAPEPLLALWDVAVRAPGVEVPETPEPPEPAEPSALPGEPGRPGTRRTRPALLVPVLAVAVIAAVVALLVASPWDSGGSKEAEDSGPAAGAESPEPVTDSPSVIIYDCQFYVRDGLRFAGHSTTMTAEYGVAQGGEPVAEVQCLVRYHGFDPGVIDGAFGPNTKRAVQEFQRSRGLTDDGIVGPMTWEALRATGEGGA